MTANELRQLFINFFIERGHKHIPSASLIPENDPSVLFTTAGMHPLVPYLLGERHPLGKRLVDCQKCLRTDDIDEVGNTTHLTFFEMLGNWSLGDYFKKESIGFSHEFLTKYLKIPQDKISVTCFAGDDDAPRDDEAADAWRELGYPDERIYFYPKKENWWGPAGQTGPCGPDTEIFYDTGAEKCGPDCQPSCSCGKYVEIWNNVFMQYSKDDKGKFTLLSQKNVDTGLGFERTLCVMNNVASVFDTELFVPIIKKIEELTGTKYAEPNVRAHRIIADHLRAATFVLGDDKGVSPSNTDQGYILRRLIRRAYRYLTQLGAPDRSMSVIARIVIENYKDIYPELERNQEFVIKQLDREEELFGRTLESGMKIATKELDFVQNGKLAAAKAFKLYDTYGFPLEFTQELAAERGITIDIDGFHRLYAEHQEKSRVGAQQKFKGGLADNSEETTKLHTAAHLLQAALRRVLGDSVFQKGSNITAERLRFDFSFDRRVEPDELAKVECIVNDAIALGIPVGCAEMSVQDAKAAGAIGIFDDKYGDNVKVYTIGDYSKEICGGPHAANTADLIRFKIKKEESIAAGVRRIKAVIGDAAK
ncbi:MAG: alanine--tRNA ligase [Alphaproteobacteria bacterium]|nr:alanine--tRNA ligase [Alphaproteobacteria bacterium]